MKKLLNALLFGSLFLTACATTSPTQPPTAIAENPTAIAAPTETPVPQPTASPFDYNPDLAFDAKIIKETEQDGVAILEVTYATHDKTFSKTVGGRTSAYLVKPLGAAAGSAPGVLFLHWLGAFNGNKKEFLNEAIALAQHGVVCLLLQGQIPWMSQFVFNERDITGIQKQIIEMRRGLDYLQAQPEVDSARLGVVGHDYGGMYAGILSGVDFRAKTYVIVAAAPRFGDWAPNYSQNLEEVNQLMASIQPIDYVSRSQNGSFLFQFGNQDGFANGKNAQAFFAAAAGKKEIKFYDAGHSMVIAEVQAERDAWLAQELNFALEP